MDPGKGGGIHADIGVVLPGFRAGKPNFRLGDVGGDPSHWEGPGGFHNWVARYIKENHPRKQADGIWKYPP